MVFIFLSCHEKALVEKEFLRENSKRSCESQITTQTLKFILSDKLSAQYFVCALFFHVIFFMHVQLFCVYSCLKFCSMQFIFIKKVYLKVIRHYVYLQLGTVLFLSV